ncbi:hypothetical protein FACS1894151_00250 [Spirochaetia bacterium]|nr:hypothetical protein FACS1894151_00250 [Spirochaetia bacterium]
MAKDRIMILGAGVMQGPAIRIAKEMGLETVVVDGDASARHVKDADRFEPIDLKDKEGIERFARKIKEDLIEGRSGLSGIMTAGTDFSATVAWVSEKLGLPGIPYETALDASDKSRMRARFEKAGVPSPAFTVVTSPPGAGFTLPLAFPVVVKPVDNMGSRGCRRVDSSAELKDAVSAALGFSRSGRVIVEQYMDGPEYSVDAIVFNGEITICGLADRHIFYPPYFIEMGHTMPTVLDAASQKALLDTFAAGVRALGLTLGAAKGDVKLTSRGPMIGEIAARLSGGYMSGWTYPYASGVEPARAAILACMGKKPDGLVPVKTWTSAERAFISIPGTIRSIQGLDQASSVPFVKDLFLRAAPGKSVRFPENNVSKCGNVISAAADRESAVGAAENAVRAVLIELEAPNSETEAFLADTSSFPPSAFVLDQALSDQLSAFPEPDPSVYTESPAALPLAIFDFPALTSSALTDYVGRSVSESLDALRKLSGLPLPLVNGTGETGKKHRILGKKFWQAFVRGGYQGAAYIINCFNRRE